MPRAGVRSFVAASRSIAIIRVLKERPFENRDAAPSPKN
jgi:hypothetical protein